MMRRAVHAAIVTRVHDLPKLLHLLLEFPHRLLSARSELIDGSRGTVAQAARTVRGGRSHQRSGVFIFVIERHRRGGGQIHGAAAAAEAAVAEAAAGVCTPERVIREARHLEQRRR